MTYACQKDSYLKQLTVKVLSCTPKKDNFIDGDCEYEIILEDTILFPEGGGQPDDRGTLNEIPVLGIKRRGNDAIHIVRSPVIPGEDVKLEVDWERRFDHMQQHTGQHLITALAEKTFDFCTTSWNLGEYVSFIELDTPSIGMKKIYELEQVVNKAIQSCVPITIHLYEKGDPELSKVRSRLELPDDHDGPVRVVEIQHIDSNTCCGTHVKNTSDLQAIKLLYAEKGKKNKTNLFFVCGERLLKYMSDCISREQKLSQILRCTPEQQQMFVEKLQKSLKSANKNALLASRDVASLEAKLFMLSHNKPLYFSLHRKNAEPEFMSFFINEVACDSTLFFLTVGEDNNGHMLMTGPSALVEELAPQICSILEGKGAIKNGKFQGKVKKLSSIPAADCLLRKIFNR